MIVMCMYTELNNNKVQTEKSSPCKIIIFLEASLLFILIIKLSKEVRKKIKTIDSYINSTRVKIGIIQNSSKSVINQKKMLQFSSLQNFCDGLKNEKVSWFWKP